MKLSNLFTIILFGLLFFAISSCSKKTTQSNASTPEQVTKRGKDGKQRKKGTSQFAQLLERMDSNKDLKLSGDEVRGRLKDRFASIDQNNDGFITEEEFNAIPRPKRSGQIPTEKQ